MIKEKIPTAFMSNVDHYNFIAYYQFHVLIEFCHLTSYLK